MFRNSNQPSVELSGQFAKLIDDGRPGKADRRSCRADAVAVPDCSAWITRRRAPAELAKVWVTG